MNKLVVDPQRLFGFIAVLLIALAFWSLVGFVVAAFAGSAAWMWVTFTLIVVTGLGAEFASEQVR